MTKRNGQKNFWRNLKELLAIEPGPRHRAAYTDMQQGLEQLNFTFGGPILLCGDRLQNNEENDSAKREKRPIGIIGGMCFLP